MAHGSSHVEALDNAQEAISFWIDTAKEIGRCSSEQSG
jgi:predicted RNase H-like HicB family nuclease